MRPRHASGNGRCAVLCAYRNGELPCAECRLIHGPQLLYHQRRHHGGTGAELFNFLTGRSLKRDYQTLLVAPFTMKERFISLIERESERADLGKPARIVAKANSLEDHGIISALYKASQAGVEIDLIIRGLCCLRPGVPGLSESIRVSSIIGRLLEHSRIFFFRNGAENPLDGDFFIGSADWMYRNLLSRVEVVAPLSEKSIKERCYEILTIMLEDKLQSWRMQPSGAYVKERYAAKAGEPQSIGCQDTLMRLSREHLAAYLQTDGEKGAGRRGVEHSIS